MSPFPKYNGLTHHQIGHSEGSKSWQGMLTMVPEKNDTRDSQMGRGSSPETVTGPASVIFGQIASDFYLSPPPHLPIYSTVVDLFFVCRALRVAEPFGYNGGFTLLDAPKTNSRNFTFFSGTVL